MEEKLWFAYQKLLRIRDQIKNLHKTHIIIEEICQRYAQIIILMMMVAKPTDGKMTHNYLIFNRPYTQLFISMSQSWAIPNTVSCEIDTRYKLVADTAHMIGSIRFRYWRFAGNASHGNVARRCHWIPKWHPLHASPLWDLSPLLKPKWFGKKAPF